MRMMFVASIAAITLTCGAANAADDAKKIAQDLTDKWVAAYNSGNAKGVAALYTKDALFSATATNGILKGPDAIAKYLEGGIKQGFKISVVIREARMEPNGAVTGAGEYTFTGSGETEGKKISGYYGTADVKSGKDWKIFLHFSNIPAPAPATAPAKTQ